MPGRPNSSHETVAEAGVGLGMPNVLMDAVVVEVDNDYFPNLTGDHADVQ